MKRFALLLSLVIVCGCAWAQNDETRRNDLIVTVKSEKIDAVIIEVGTEVRYRKADNPDGPVFSISTDNISSILYADGNVQVFSKKNKTAQSDQSADRSQQSAYDSGKPVSYGMFIEPVGTICKPKGSDKVGGSIGGEMTFGANMAKRHLFLGAGIGGHGYFHNNETSYAKTKMQWPYMTVFANARGFFFGKDNDMFIDLALGGYIAFKAETTYTPKSGRTEKYKQEMKSGLLFRIGLGAAFGRFTMGAGYEMKKPSEGNAYNSAYMKIGICIR